MRWAYPSSRVAWLLAASLLLAPVVCGAQAQVPQPTIEVEQSTQPSDLPVRSPAQFADNATRLRNLLIACRGKASACEPEEVGEDFQVARPSGNFDVRYRWLRDALSEAKDVKKTDDAARADLMQKAAARLDADAAVASAPSTSASDPKIARARADAILAQKEFRFVDPNSELGKRWAVILLAIDQFFSGLFAHVPHAPWAVPLFEWGLLILAAAALLIWAWQTTRQQRLAIAAPVEARTAVWQKESDDWARKAEEQAAAANWREAVHCLYWAAIVMLEGKRMWRANRSRTPREYLPLLEAGSSRRTALTRLTRIFERIWYGLRPAEQSDFERAQALLEELKAA